jgi:glutamyl endopeptidase
MRRDRPARDIGPDLSEDRRKTSIAALERALHHDAVESQAPSLSPDDVDQVLKFADEVLRRLGGEGPGTPLGPAAATGLEAIVLTDGTRPAPYVRGGFLDLTDNRLGDWRDPLREAEADIRRNTAATGRILLHGKTPHDSVYGTAWMIAEDLALTNRHVVAYLGEGTTPHDWQEKSGFSVDFAHEIDAVPDAANRAKVVGIARASSDVIDPRISNSLNLALLDAAVLRLAPLPGSGLPKPIGCMPSFVMPKDGIIYSVGHPARISQAGWLAEDGGPFDPETQLLRSALESLLGNLFGVKRLSPGRVTMPPGIAADDVKRRVLIHDATTLGGSSGAPIFDFSAKGQPAMALHFGGEFRSRNVAHPIAAIASHPDFSGIPFAAAHP